MSALDEVIARIQEMLRQQRYRVRLHAVRHMIEEGFDEKQMLEALQGAARVLEEYEDEKRVLILGYFAFGTARSPLHVVCDLSQDAMIDIVTAYIPQRPWWKTPTERGTR